jgi:superfamily II DNA or RNA helicase
VAASEPRGVVVLPTGSGKTRLAIAAMARARRPALALVPTRVLLAQWVQEISSAFGGAVGCLGDGERRVEAITVATFESGWRHMDRLGNQFELLILDEAHHFGSGVRDEVLELCAAPARLGLTATPPSGAAAARIEDLIGPTVFELSVGDLTGRYLAPFELVTLNLDLDASERAAWVHAVAVYRPALRAFMRDVPGADWLDFARTATRTEEGRRALAAFRESRALLAFPSAKRAAVRSLLARHAGARILVFTSDNATAYAVSREHLLMPITCDIPRGERAAALERFRRGELRALVSARVLNEGIDVPDADVALVVGGTQGEREHVQRIGASSAHRREDRGRVRAVMRGTSEVAQAKEARALLPANLLSCEFRDRGDPRFLGEPTGHGSGADRRVRTVCRSPHSRARSAPARSAPGAPDDKRRLAAYLLLGMARSRVSRQSHRARRGRPLHGERPVTGGRPRCRHRPLR